MSIFPIFKVNKLTNKEETDAIYVFSGSNLEVDENPNELFERDPSNKAFAKVFDKTELDNIKRNDIKVEFVKQMIHLDDSIGIIKLKIFEAIRRTASMSEIYLFCLKNEKLNPITMYQNLTQNDRLPLTHVRLDQILKNIYDEDGEPIDFGLSKKDKYTFDDILGLDLTERDYLVAKNLGQKFVFNNEYPFIADPFYVTEYDALLEHSRRELTSLNNNLLLETSNIFNNTIFLCLASDVFSAIDKIDYTSKIYYPFLYQDNIDTIEKLDDNRDKLIEATANKLTSDVEKSFESIDMFYDVFLNKMPSKKFSEKIKNTGIKFIKIIVHPEFQVKIPIDVIFKLIHATQEFPLIKFNPETRQENIYRLYTNQMTSDGRKIPFLNKAIIFKLVKNIGKSKSVAVYTNTMFEGVEYYFACEFADNGSITVYPLTDFEQSISYDKGSYEKIDTILSLVINPLIEQIKPFFEQSGLDIPLFVSIKSVNVEIRELTYQTVYAISKPIDITNYIGCVSSIFTIESANLKQGVEMRFKRVSNFNKRDSQEAFIIEKIDQGLKFDEIVDELVQNYHDVTDEIASDLIAKIRSELEVTRGANRRRTLMIKINPGFKTRISLNSIVSEITVTVDGINDIAYLNTIPVYIDTLVRISQDIASSDIEPELINRLCTGKELEDVEFGQITSISEQSIKDNQLPDIQDESPVYSAESQNPEEAADMDILDLLGYNDSESENSEVKGGQGSSDDSGKSVSTEDLSSSSSSSASASSASLPPPVLAPVASDDSGKSVSTEDLSSSTASSSSSASVPPVLAPIASDDSLTEDLSSTSSSASVPPPVLAPVASDDSLTEDLSSTSSSSSASVPPVLAPDASDDSGKSVSTEDLSSTTEDLSSATATDPNKNEFEQKPIAIPSSKKDTSVSESESETKSLEDSEPESESSESKSLEEPKSSESKSLEESESESKSSESESKEAVVAPNPVVEIEVNINKPPSPKADTPKAEEVIVPKADTPKSEEVIVPKAKKAKPAKSVKPAEKKIEAVKKELENTVRDITNMKLRYPNPFTARIEKNAPQLFVREKNDKIDVYTRMCPFSLSDRRQPVILTKEEKQNLMEDHPDLNQESDFIEYSTDPTDSSKKFYYTCPRFWCMLTDKMVTEQDILEGKCGPKVKRVEDAIIPRNADAVKNDGRYVYQFYDDNEKKYPGFHKKKTPSGLCIPCCYNKWSTEEMKNRRDLCQGKFVSDEAQSVSSDEKDFEEQLKRDVQNAENYVKGPEKYGPQLGEHRWGFLPIAVQKFLHEINEDCQISKMNANLKPNHTCILRHGVEVNSKQSFIACIASAMFYGQQDTKTKQSLITKYIPNAKHEVPSIEEMKSKIIIPAIDIDKFVKYQNGDLITSFANLDLKVDINKAEYTNSKLYKKAKEIKEDAHPLESGETHPLQFFTRAVQAYETFLEFLSDPKIYIDYTYLWDLICTPNSGLFETGINLIILEMPEDDVTNNIELVCPTNRYSTHIYDARKRSLILIKRENYFEPIYGYHNNLERGEIQITKTFSEYDRKLPKTLKAVFTKIIKPTLGERCKALPSNGEYAKKFKQPELLDTLITELIHKEYIILSQVLNFQGKVIGILTKSPTLKKGFIPCYPSSLTILKNSKKYGKKSCDINTKCEIDFVYMSDKIWKSYEETLEFLKEYYHEEDKHLEHLKHDKKGALKTSLKTPFYRVVNNELIIGFLTNTNQFIRIYDPIPVSSVDDSIKKITNEDMLVADMETLTTLKVDTKRTDFIKRIQLETNFYNVFRNTIRILFNDYSNSDKRKAIQGECNKRYIIYRQQLNKVVEMLRELVGSSIIFSTSEDGFNYKNINENDIHNCIKLSKDKCSAKNDDEDEDDDAVNGNTGICQMTEDTCTLVLPKNNLITENDNEAFYYSRMADELIRYNRIKSFIFKPQAYLSFGQIKYNLRDNEILILQDLLTQEFFENLIPADINKFAKYNTYDTANPITSLAYKKEYELNEAINPNFERDCFPSDPAPLRSDEWSACFPKTYREIAYAGKSKFCALYLIIDLIKEFKEIVLTIEEIKDALIDEYKLLTDSYKDVKKIATIINILREEGQFDANQLQDKTMNFEQMILHEGFGAVSFDMWILLVKYEIPSIFISSKVIPETRFKNKEFVCYLDDKHDGRFAFIVIPAMYKRQEMKNPEYKLIVDEHKQIKISLRALKQGECLQNIDEAVNRVYSVKNYIDEIFEKRNTTVHPARKADAVNIEFVEVTNDAAESPVVREKETEKEKEPKIVKLKKGRKLKSSFIIEEDKEDIEDTGAADTGAADTGAADTGEFEEVEVPVKAKVFNAKEKTRKTKNTKVKVNPHGKTKKKRPAPENIEFVEESNTSPLEDK